MRDTLTVRFHKDSGFPKGHPMPQPGVELAYSGHAKDAALRRLPKAVNVKQACDLLSLLPLRLPSEFEVIEVSTFAGMPAHWLVRFPLIELRVYEGNGRLYPQRTDYDVVLALGTGLSNPLTVRTVYLNHKDDKHATLRAERYQEAR